MPDRGVGVVDQPTGTGIAEVRARERTIGGTLYAEQYVIPIPERVASFKGTVSTYRTLGSAASPQNLFTVENGAASSVIVALRRITVQMDSTALLTAVATQFVASRTTAMPTGGTQLTKVTFDSGLGTSVAQVVCRGATASDGGAATAITATASARFWQQFAMRMHSLAGQVQMEDQGAIPALCAEDPIYLRPGEAFLLQAVNATAGNNKATDHYIVNAMFEEFTLP